MINTKKIIILLNMFHIVFSDVAPTEYNGYTLSPYEEKFVKLNHEKVDIYWSDVCEINAIFSLQNVSNKDINLKIGFPVNLSFLKQAKDAQIDSINRIYDFEFYLNDERLKENDIPEKAIQSDKEYWYGWFCKFKPDSNTVRLKYKVKTNSSYEYSWKKNLHYVLYTGRFWNGKIDEATVTVHFPEKLSPEQVLSETSPKNFTISSKGISWKFKNFKPSLNDNIHIQILSFPTFTKIKEYEYIYTDSSTSPENKLKMAEFYASLAPGKGIDLSAPFIFTYNYFRDTVLANSNKDEKDIISNAFKLELNKNNESFYCVKSLKDFRENDSLQNTMNRVMERIYYFENVKYPEIYKFIQRSKNLYNLLTISNPNNCVFWLSYINHYYLIESEGAHPCIPYVGADNFSKKQKSIINQAYAGCKSNKEIELLYNLIHREFAELPDTVGKKPNANSNDILIKHRCEQCWRTVSFTDDEIDLVKKKYDLTEANFFVKTNRIISDNDKVTIIDILYRSKYYKFDFCRKMEKIR